MNKKYIITKNEEIEKIVKTGKKKVSRYYIIYYIDNNEENYNKYCISVSKKLGKANVRNKIKRRIKDILVKNKMELSKKYVIIIRKVGIEASYEDLKEKLIAEIKGEKNEKN